MTSISQKTIKFRKKIFGNFVSHTITIDIWDTEKIPRWSLLSLSGSYRQWILNEIYLEPRKDFDVTNSLKKNRNWLLQGSKI